MEENIFNDCIDSLRSVERCSSPNSSDNFLIGFIVAKIVGIQYYHGRISGRELVGLIRDPMNPNDPNAIKAINKNGDQLGHIERSVAAVLSSLIDDGIIVVEGIVPRVKHRHDSAYKISCQIHVFCKIHAFTEVKSTISRSGLQFVMNSDASFTLSDSAAVKETKSTLPVRSVDDVFRSADETFEKSERFGVLHPPKDVIISELFLHQKEGLCWLFDRENSYELPPFWEMNDGMYVNVLTNFMTCTRPKPLRGGIFADDMGLGKTLTLLSLIALDKNEKSSSIEAANATNSVTEIQASTRLSSCSSSRRNTLIVCPPSAFSAWVTQLERHTKSGSLNVYMYYGERTNEVGVLKMHDIVLTTYNTLSSEHNSRDSPVKKVSWWRIILDEAHVIKNPISMQSKAVFELSGERKWVVTGIPMHNYTSDMFSFMVFLGFQPFSILSCWNTLIKNPLIQDYQKGWHRLQVLIKMLSLRRTKERGVVGLTPKTVEMCYVELCKEEREVYDTLEEEAKRLIQQKETTPYYQLYELVFGLRQICTYAALSPPILTSLFTTSNIEDVVDDLELVKKAVETAENEGDELDCPVCLGPPTSVLITRCGHIFCRSCLRTILIQSDPLCPLCRRRLSQTDVFSASSSASSTAAATEAGGLSSKAAALLRLLAEARKRDAGMKSVVFSQFGGVLLLLKRQLEAEGFHTVRLDGQMGARKKALVVKELTVGAPTVMLASRGVGGLDLTAASMVCIMEPWWDPWVEEMAVDRVHRMGQRMAVRVVKLVARNSLEEKMVELQEKRKKKEVGGGCNVGFRSMDILVSLFS